MTPLNIELFAVHLADGAQARRTACRDHPAISFLPLRGTIVRRPKRVQINDACAYFG